jgi:hypothetical protein
MDHSIATVAPTRIAAISRAAVFDLFENHPRIGAARRDNLIALAHQRLTLLDVEKLQKIAGFNQDYLHLSGATAEVRSYIPRSDGMRSSSTRFGGVAR